MIKNTESIDGNKPLDNHPMSNIEVRRLQFRFYHLTPEKVVWSKSSPIFSIFANAMNLHVPFFEQYLIKSMVEAKSRTKDKNLLNDIDKIIGQEGQHAYSFMAFNALLKKRYPLAEKLESHVKDDFDQRFKNDSFKSMLGFTAGYETFTFLAGMIFLNNYEKWFADSDPTIKAMWVWHQVEEVEHGAVAFDVYQHFFGDDENFRRKMVISAFIHIVKETWVAYWHMCHVEKHSSSPWRKIKSAAFLFSILGQMVWNCRGVFSLNYHPRKHHFATTKQNKIALSWRKFHKKGGDVLEIDRIKMSKIMNIS